MFHKKKNRIAIFGFTILFSLGISYAVSEIDGNSNVEAAVDLVADVASYQPSSLGFFQSLRNKGVKAVTIKLTEGTSYFNSKAADQLKNAQAAGLNINVYHYARFNSSKSVSPKAEADYFASKVRALAVPNSAVLALDIEDSDNYTNSAQITNDINIFSSRLHSLGFNKTATYSFRSWFSSGQHIIVKELRDPNLWIAEYGVPNIAYSTNAWQFTNKWDSGYQNNLIDMSYIYDGYLSHTSNSFVIVDRQSITKNVVLESNAYNLFNTPSPVSGSKLLIAGSDLQAQTVKAVAMYKVSNGEYYYNFKYGDRYYWCNTRAFSDKVTIKTEELIDKKIQVNSTTYGFYNTPSNLSNAKLMISGNKVPQITLNAVAKYTLNDGTSYYNFQYGDRYYWADIRAFKNVSEISISEREIINNNYLITSGEYGLYNTPASLSDSTLLLSGSEVFGKTIHAVARYTLSDGTSYLNFKYGGRFYWMDTRALQSKVTIQNTELLTKDVLLESKNYGLYNTPAGLSNTQLLITPEQVPTAKVRVIAKYTLSTGTSFYNFKYGDRYYWADVRAFKKVTLSSTSLIDLSVQLNSRQYGLYNTPAGLNESILLIAAKDAPQVTVRAIARNVLSDGTSYYNFKYGDRYYWTDTRAFNEVAIHSMVATDKNMRIISRTYGFYNTPANLSGATLLVTASSVPQAMVRVIAQYTLSDGTSYYNFKYGGRYYWLDTRAFN